MLITRLSKADKKNRPGRSPTICRRFDSVTCGNRNETLKYPGRFHRDTERYFRKTGTIFEKNRFRQIWSIISLSISNEISPSECNNTTHCYHSGTISWLPIQRLWVRFSVTLWMRLPLVNYVKILIVKTSYLQKFKVQTCCWVLVCSWWDSISGSSWSQIDVITTYRCGMTQFLCATQINWSYLYQ